MKYVAAYLLATIGGKAEPSKKDIENILASVGADADAEQTNAVLNALKGKKLEEVIAEGTKKLATVPSAKKQEKEESEDEDMGFGLFD